MFSHFLRKLTVFRSAAGLRSLRLGGRKWRLAPNAMAVFGPAGPDLDRWIANGSAAIVKTGPHRTVYRVTLPGGVVYVKHCRVMGTRAWLREVVRPAKARLEFENLLALQDRGISAAVPLAWASADTAWPGESWLITKSLDGAVPFTEHIEKPLTADQRRELARSLGRFFAKLHEAGVAHPDPHPGNLLVADGRFSLIDLHAVGLSSPLSWKQRRANLVLFNRWFQLRATRTDRLRFWKAYCSENALDPEPRRVGRTAANREAMAAGGPRGEPVGDAAWASRDGRFRGHRDPAHPTSATSAKDVELATSASNRRFWAGRVSRCLGSNRYFRKLRCGEFRGFGVRDLPEEVRTRLTADPEALFTNARILKDSRTSKVAIVSFGGRELLLKRVNVRSWIEPLKNALRPSAIIRSWINGHSLRDRWLPTPRPLAVIHRYRHGMPSEGYLLTELVEAPEPLAANPQATERLARMLRMMHDRGVSHRDLKASNILLERGSEPVLIDLVGVRLGSPVSFARRTKELARINASFLTTVARSARLRFLFTYLNAGESRITNWRKWWKAIAAATAVKQAKNLRSGRPLA